MSDLAVRTMYKVVVPFISDNPNITAEAGDVVYKNAGDNNFYIEKESKVKFTSMLDWSLAMKALRFGWIKLVMVERVKP